MPSITTTSHLLALPLELRLKIYTHLLTRRRSSTAFQETFPRPLLLTNRQLHNEASTHFYTHNIFALELDDISPDIQNSFAHLTRSRYWGLVRNYRLMISLLWIGITSGDSSAEPSPERAHLRLCLQNLCALLATAPRIRKLTLNVREVPIDESDENLQRLRWTLEPLRLLAKHVDIVEVTSYHPRDATFRVNWADEDEKNKGVDARKQLLFTFLGEMKALMEER